MTSQNKIKTKDIGWMYYSPNKREERDPVGYPPTSQIPGLGSQEGQQPPPFENKMWIKETDSAYIRLAKQGGRPDLLTITENTRNEEPQGYPRCDWFYMEDNRVDQEKPEPYVFKLPEYMVQRNMRGTGRPDGPQQEGTSEGGFEDDGSYRPSRLPYADDTTTIYQRDHHCTDKTIQIPNVRRQGYGVRMERQKQSDTTVAHGSNNGTQRRAVKSEEAVNMGKLMAGTYEHEWHEKNKQRSHPKAGGAKPHTEYQEAYQAAIDAAKAAKRSGGKPGLPGSHGSVTPHNCLAVEEPRDTRRSPRSPDKMDSDAFKLSRFKNVNARVGTNAGYQPSPDSAPRRRVPP